MEERIIHILKQIDTFPVEGINEVLELLEHNEWGIAFETICSVLLLLELPITSSVYKEIEYAGEMMELDSITWKDLIVR